MSATLGLAALLLARSYARDLDPQIVAKWPGFSRGSAAAVTVAGDYAYLAAGTLQVLDVRHPASPQLVRGYPKLKNARDVALVGGYAYVVDEGAGLYILNLDILAATPAPVGGYDQASGVPESVAASADYAYVTGSAFGLHILDVRDPAHPQRVGACTIPFPSRAMVSDHFAYVVERRTTSGRDQGRLHVIDISVPSRPRQVGAHDTAVHPQSMAVSKNRAWLALEAGLQVVDVSDPANPRQAGSYAVGGWVTGLVVSGDILYVSHGLGLEVINIRDPAHPERIGVKEGMAGTVSGLTISGQHLYLSLWDAGLQIMDVSTPARPRPLGSFATYGDVLGVAVSGQYAYLADAAAGLEVIEISDPAVPWRVGGLVTTNPAVDLGVSGPYVYVVTQGRLEVIHVGDPSKPQLTGGVDLARPAAAIAVTSNYVYVAESWWDGEAARKRTRLELVDVTNPRNPRNTSQYEATAQPGPPHYGQNTGVAVSGSYAYLTWSHNDMHGRSIGRLEVIDVSGAQLTLSGTRRDLKGG